MIKEPLTKERLEEILKSKKLERLIGYAENSFFDAKKDFYNLSVDDDKHELCKDITAFANNNGGYIIIGCDTDKPKTRFVEFVKSADGIADFPNMDRISSTLKEYVYPNNIGALINFENIITESDKKFLLIIIVKNSEEGPYFVRRYAHDREFIAYYVRTNDSGVRLHLEYLHELVRQGIYFEKYLKNISGTTEKILSNTEKLIGKSAKTISLGMRYDIKKDL